MKTLVVLNLRLLFAMLFFGWISPTSSPAFVNDLCRGALTKLYSEHWQRIPFSWEKSAAAQELIERHRSDYMEPAVTRIKRFADNQIHQQLSAELRSISKEDLEQSFTDYLMAQAIERASRQMHLLSMNQIREWIELIQSPEMIEKAILVASPFIFQPYYHDLLVVRPFMTSDASRFQLVINLGMKFSEFSANQIHDVMKPLPKGLRRDQMILDLVKYYFLKTTLESSEIAIAELVSLIGNSAIASEVVRKLKQGNILALNGISCLDDTESIESMFGWIRTETTKTVIYYSSDLRNKIVLKNRSLVDSHERYADETRKGIAEAVLFKKDFIEN